MPKGGARKGAGRPPIANARVAKLDIRITPKKLEEYRSAAAKEGVTLTEWVERAMEMAAGASGRRREGR